MLGIVVGELPDGADDCTDGRRRSVCVPFKEGCVRLEGGGCRWSGCGTNLQVSPMGEMGVGSVGLKQQLRSIAQDCGLEAELKVWKAAESLACLLRV